MYFREILQALTLGEARAGRVVRSSDKYVAGAGTGGPRLR
jgi:hypothetical protein